MVKQKRKFGLIAGASGIGKGYGVGQVLEEYYGAKVFVTGDWCREHTSELADKGTLTSDDLILSAVQDHFHRHDEWHYFVDAPRSSGQIDSLIRMFTEKDPDAEIYTLHLNGSRKLCEALLRDRALRKNRSDDAKPEVIRRRLDGWFSSGGISDQIIPILKLRTQYKKIQGHVNIEIVRKHVHEKLCPDVFGGISSRQLVHIP